MISDSSMLHPPNMRTHTLLFLFVSSKTLSHLIGGVRLPGNLIIGVRYLPNLTTQRRQLLGVGIRRPFWRHDTGGDEACSRAFSASKRTSTAEVLYFELEL